MSDGGGHDGYAVGPAPSPSEPPVVVTTKADLRRAAPRGAQQLATWLPDGSSVPWRGLEVAAYARRPAVQDALDPRRRWRRRADLLPDTVLWSLTVLAVLGAVVTATLLGGEAGYGAPSAASADRWGAVAATVGAAALLARTASWGATRLAGRRPHSFDLVLAAVVTLAVHGLATLGWIVSAGRWSRTPSMPVGVALILAVVALALVALTRQPAPEVTDAPGAAPDPRRLAAALRPQEQQRVRDDLDAAIAVLERRGMATPATLARARTAPLGALADTALRRRRR
ncbi:hypothetical protein RDV89_16265 [Nocardioides zeae]|uniref:DUF2637 domain-containing protein n=1 Tax=Nocardioides imazamoxiresistens TaxID=3231893 RepID=A0ABU3PZG5_9ACTN|nr:hypothetical protein [Nocardioides zeae]MDT9594641.1 hypothetical protein [Nocardioides zeae]